MAVVLTDSKNYTDIANAIRAKNGSAETYKPGEMPEAIRNLPSGGGVDVIPLDVTENGNYEAPDGKAYSPVNVNVPTTVDSKEDEIVMKTISGTYENNRITRIGSYVFQSCTRLESVNFPECKSVGYAAFQYCTSLTTVNLETCSTLGAYAFASCRNLSNLNIINCTSMESNAFANCANLTRVVLPNCSQMSNHAFFNCYKLQEIDMPLVTTIKSSAFYSCSRLSSINFPSAIIIESSAFCNCSALTKSTFNSVIRIENSAFYNCMNLSYIKLPKLSSTYGQKIFANCFNLKTIIIGASSVCYLAYSNVFLSTPIDGYTESTGGVLGSIYVPASLIDSYKVANNWSYYSSRFAPIEDLPTT